jgi:hypothetical protein
MRSQQQIMSGLPSGVRRCAHTTGHQGEALEAGSNVEQSWRARAHSNHEGCRAALRSCVASRSTEVGSGAFPAEITLPGWSLEVTEHRIAAHPQTNIYDEGSAREALEPSMDAWAAELTVVHNTPMAYWFLNH